MQTISRTQVARYVAQAWVDKSVPRATLVAQMAAYLQQTGRSKQAELLVKDVKHQIEKQYGIVVADVFSAFELSTALKKATALYIQKETNAKKVVITEHIDTSLLGGLVAKTAEMEIDLSVRGKLNSLHEQ